MKHRIMELKKPIALTLIVSMMLTGCQTSTSTNTEISATETQTYEVNNVAIAECVDSNIVANTNTAYTDTDFSTPEDYYYKYSNIDYGVIDDNVTYYSSTIGEDKTCGVLLPASYSPDEEYPVIYLLHGFGGDHYDWNRGDSYVQDIYGNMLANGTAVPAIIVMPDMYTAAADTKENATGAETRAAYDNFINDLENDLMPYIESHYSVKTGRENTAIIGTSQGGTESLAIGFELQDEIGYIGSLAPCPGVIPTDFYTDTFWNIPLLSDFTIEDASNTPYYIQLTVGDQDPWCLDSTQYYDEILTQENIAHTYYLLADVGHEDAVWENGIYNFLKRVFK